MDEFRISSGIVGGIIASFAIAWAAKDSQFPIPRGVAVYGWRMRFLAIFVSFLGFFLVYASLQASKDQELAAGILGFISFALAVIFPLETFITRFVALETGLQLRTPWRGTRIIPWQAIDGYKYRSTLEVYEIKTHGFGNIYLSKLLIGVSDLLSTISNKGSSRAS